MLSRIGSLFKAFSQNLVKLTCARIIALASILGPLPAYCQSEDSDQSLTNAKTQSKSDTYVIDGNELKAATEKAIAKSNRANRFKIYRTLRLLDQGHNAAAAQEIKPLLKEESFKAIGNNLFGQALFRSGQTIESLPYLERAYQSQPSIPGLAEAYFDALISKRNYREALMPGLVMLSQENPKNGRAPIVRRKLRTILPHIPDRELKSAIDQAAMHIHEGPSQCSFYLALAHMCDRVGKRTLAIACYIPGLAVTPENPGEYIRYARDLEMFNGDPKQIHELYQRSLQALPDHPALVAAYRRYLQQSGCKKRNIASGIKDSINHQLYK
jgi:tetratricopeptide (TPR) repeat protein